MFEKSVTFFLFFRLFLWNSYFIFLNSTIVFESISFWVIVKDTQSEKNCFCSSVSRTASDPSQKNWDNVMPKPSQSVLTVDIVGVVERLSILDNVEFGSPVSFARRYIVQPLSFISWIIRDLISIINSPFYYYLWLYYSAKFLTIIVLIRVWIMTSFWYYPDGKNNLKYF